MAWKRSLLLLALAELSACGGRAAVSDTTETTESSADGQSGDEGVAESEVDTGLPPDLGSSVDASTTDDGGCSSDEDCHESEFCDESTGECMQDCGIAYVEVEFQRPPVMLLIDRSDEMGAPTWDDDADSGTPLVAPYSGLRTALDLVTDDFEGSLSYGLQFFPSAEASNACINAPECSACQLMEAPELLPDGGNHDALVEAMPPAQLIPPVGARPLALAFESAAGAAVDALTSDTPAPNVILITNGAPNCAAAHQDADCIDPGPSQGSSDCPALNALDPAPAGALAQALSDHGLRTHVVGMDVPNSVLDPDSALDDQVDATNPHLVLSELGAAGGAPAGDSNYWTATSQPELESALRQISEQLSSCIVDLSAPPNQPPETNQIPYMGIEVMGQEVPGPLDFTGGCPEDDPNTLIDDGWVWVEQGLRFELCGDYCEQARGLEHFEVIYHCPPTP